MKDPSLQQQQRDQKLQTSMTGKTTMYWHQYQHLPPAQNKEHERKYKTMVSPNVLVAYPTIQSNDLHQVKKNVP
jgi:hypothetical protein